ncbi:MAG: DUF2203 domain-containing protein [Candidatus Eremiobacteraeota bacterium]|nr:DUF2203 domain-containing protein [Candidatus Eremiobacteraeota bacterium]
MNFFSPEKASALIPVLAPLIDEMWRKRRELAIKLLEQDPALRKAGGRAGASTAARRGESRRCTELKAEVVRIINRIEAYGCFVKDIDLGLLDFPALREGRSIFLCWKSGEDDVAHWHGTDETFVDRRPL